MRVCPVILSEAEAWPKCAQPKYVARPRIFRTMRRRIQSSDMNHVSPSRCLVAPLAAIAAQQPLPIQDGQVIPLWSGPAPGALGTDTTDIPAIMVFLPRNVTPNTPAIIVCPGGSYQRLASNHEGRQVANYLNSLGIAAFVLRYRLGPKYHHPIELGDVQRAIRLVRSHAADWRLDPARIGIMGFSAGGHLAMTASTHFDAGNANATDAVDRVGSRPDIAILGYPVISMTEPWTHAGSRTALLGENPDPQLAASLSGENAVTEGDAADLHLSDERGHDGAGGERRLLLSRAAPRGRAGGDARVRARAARRRPGELGSGALGVVEVAGELAARARRDQVARSTSSIRTIARPHIDTRDSTTGVRSDLMINDLVEELFRPGDHRGRRVRVYDRRAWEHGGESGRTATPIKHLVVIFGENISFDHYFGVYPEATNPPGEPAFTAVREYADA